MENKNIITRCLRKWVKPLLPARRRLPFEWWLRSKYERPEPELVHLDRLAVRRGVAIDAGANMGLYALRMAALFKKVYAFEINAEISRDLKNCGFSNVEVVDVGLSNRAGPRTLYTPVTGHGLPLHGWASLEPGNFPGTNQHLETPAMVRPLDEFGISDCALIKIDVEGHELQLLEGAVKTLERGRPVVLIEIRDHHRRQAGQFFDALGYRETNLQELIGLPGSPDNSVFLPQ